MKDWLISELRAIAAPQEAARYALSLSEERIVLLERTGEGDVPLAEARYGSESWESDLKALRRKAGGARKPARVDLLLPPELTLARIDRFPGDARKNLREAVWWRLDTMSRHRPEDLCFDAAIVESDPATGFLQVNVAITTKDTVEEALTFANEHGFRAQRISAAAAFDGFPNGPLFHRAARNRSDTYSLRRTAAALAATCLLLALLGGSRALLERNAAASEVEDRRVAAETAFAEAAELRTDTLDLARRAATPAARRKNEPLLVDLVESLGRLLPPTSYAERVVMQGPTWRIEGVAANADAVLSALEVSDDFSTARYAAPPRPAPDGRGQIFVIEASLRAREGAQ